MEGGKVGKRLKERVVKLKSTILDQGSRLVMSSELGQIWREIQ